MQTAVQYWHKQAVLHAIAATEASQSKIKQAGDKFELYSKKADKEVSINITYNLECNTKGNASFLD